MKKVSLLIILFFIHHFAIGQNNRIDSLTQLIEKTDNDLDKAKGFLLRSKLFTPTQLAKALDDAQNALILYRQNNNAEGEIDACLQLSEVYGIQSIYKTSLQFDSTAYLLATQNQFKKQEALALSNIGRNLSQIGFLKEAELPLKKSISLFNTFNAPKDLVEATSRLGLNYFRLSQRENALMEYDKAIQLAEKNNLESLLARLYMLKGIVYTDNAQFDKAMEFHIKCIRIREKINDERGLMQSYTNLSIVYSNLKDFKQSIDYTFKAIRLGKKFQNQTTLGNNYSNLARTYIYLKQYDSVKYYFDQALNSFMQSGEKPGLALVYFNYASFLFSQNKMAEAESFYLKSVNLNRQMNTLFNLAANYQGLGVLYTKKGDTKKAEYYLTESLKLLKDENGPREADAYKRLSDYYKSVRNFDKAQQYESVFWSIQDTLVTENEVRKSLNIASAYEIEKRDAKLALEKKEKELQQLLVAKKNEQFNYLLAGFALVLIIGIILLRAYQKQQKLSYQLKQQNTQIETLMHELHHRVKNNLQLVSGLLSLQSLRTHDPIVKEAINQGRTRLDAMALIHQKLYTQNKSSNVNMQEYIISLTHSLAESFGYSDKNINTSIQLTNQLFDIDVAIPVGLIVNELVTNAFKHAFDSKDEPLVSIQLNSLSNEQMQLIIADNGKGIDTNAPEKTGSFGMNLVQTLVRQLNGNMEIKTNGGTYYSITFNK